MMHLQDDRWVINLLYDGDCPSCMKQVEFLQKRMDENPQYQGLVAFTNLHDPDYDPDLCGGVVFEDGMRHIHAVTRDGEVIAGMDVFRRVYSVDLSGSPSLNTPLDDDTTDAAVSLTRPTERIGVNLRKGHHAEAQAVLWPQQLAPRKSFSSVASMSDVQQQDADADRSDDTSSSSSSSSEPINCIWD
eukprot:symbB.v1.2.039677.t1/scaffold6720.1/size16015/1